MALAKGTSATARTIRSGTLDIEAFKTCVSKLKTWNPDYLDDDYASVSASSATPFHDVMRVALTLKAPGLFSRLGLRWEGD